MKCINRIDRIAFGGRIRKGRRDGNFLIVHAFPFYPTAEGDPAYPVIIFY
jgi:hypothetical protein